jgi:ABC-type sugar transport system substrate-binding protein
MHDCVRKIKIGFFSAVIAIIVTAAVACGQSLAPKAEIQAEKAKNPVVAEKGRRIQVTFINPGISDRDNPTGTFWLSVSAFMQAAAADLDMDLEIIYSERNHVLMKEQARDVASRATPPDVVVAVNEKLAACEMVKNLASAGLNVFVLLNTFVDDQAEEMQKPRVKFRSYLGSLVPDNSAAGYLLARTLFDKARQEGHGATGGKIEVIAINGDFVTPAAIARNVGLHLAVDESEEIDLKQVFVGQWNREKAYVQTQGALVRYPQISVVWTANDPMALGALDAVREAGKISGKDIMIGGVNWDLPALLEVRDGGLVASAGSHFMAGAWALVMLYDYFHGRDFADIGTELQLPLFSLLDRQSVARYLAVFGDGDWDKIDFRKFSRKLNPDLQQYDFSMEKVYKSIEQ